MKSLVKEMGVFEAILARRSVRQYTSKKVDARRIRSLIQAAVKSPTAMHKEPWGFVIVQNKKTLQDLSDFSKPLFVEQIKHDTHSVDMFKKPTFNIFYDAGTLVIVCKNKEGSGSGSDSDADCWLAAENLMLAACAMNLGTCVIGAALLGLNDAKEKLKLGIPDNFEAVAPIIVGFPSGETAASQRKVPLVLSWL